jgi:hypothetical protein
LSAHNPYAPKRKSIKKTEEPTPVVAAPVYEVPEGSISVILKWVDGDSAKAKAAYDVELKDDKPRVSLLGQLEDLF